METSFAQFTEKMRKFDDNFNKNNEKVNNMYETMEGLDRETKKLLDQMNENNKKLRNILDRF